MRDGSAAVTTCAMPYGEFAFLCACVNSRMGGGLAEAVGTQDLPPCVHTNCGSSLGGGTAFKSSMAPLIH